MSAKTDWLTRLTTEDENEESSYNTYKRDLEHATTDRDVALTAATKQNYLDQAMAATELVQMTGRLNEEFSRESLITAQATEIALLDDQGQLKTKVAQRSADAARRCAGSSPRRIRC